jgi:hypothetical protein
MIYFRFIVFSIVFSVLYYPVALYSQTSLPDIQAVTVWGESSITQDPAYDKQLAIAHARRVALEKVVGSYVTSTTHVRNFQVVEDRIYSKATGFINDFKLLQEQRYQLQRVQIEAKVSLVPVTEILRVSGLLRKWRVGVILSPNPQKLSIMLTYYSQSRIMEVTNNIEASIGQRLVQAGFKVVDPRHLKKLRDKLKQSGVFSDDTFSGIDLLIHGSVSLSSRSSSGTMKQAVCQIHGKVIRADTGEIVYQGNIGNTFDGTTLLVNRDLAMKYATSMGNGILSDGTPDLRTFGVGDAAALDKAIQQSSAMVADEMVSQISRIPSAASATITLEIYGLEFSQVMDFEDHLTHIQGISNVIAEEFAGSSQNLEVEFDGDAMMLARALSKSAFLKDKGLKVRNVTKNRIVLKKY